MSSERAKRKLSAILSADVKGYSRLMREDELSTIETLKQYREVMATLIEQYRGRVVDSPGDNLLAEFASVVDAVECAVEIQKELKARNASLLDNRKMEFRIGINLGDVIEDSLRIYGDGVNIAARLEGLAEGGGICISRTVYEHAKDKLSLGYEYMGEQIVKNISEPVHVYRVLSDLEATAAVGRNKRPDRKNWWRLAMIIVIILVVGAGTAAIWKFYNPTSPQPGEIVTKQSGGFEVPDKPSIAVLPFENLSDDPKQEYFSDGMTDDLITDLSKISGLLVISRNSTFIYKGTPVNIQKVALELGVRYVLEGSVRKAEERVRINAQLIDATTGGHVWAERYDRELKDIFELQDEVTKKIVTALALTLTPGEQERLSQKSTGNLEAYDYFLRGLDYYWRFSKETNTRARQFFRKAVELDSEFAVAYTKLGWTFFNDWVMGWRQDPKTLDQAMELAQKAISVDETLSQAYCLIASVYLWEKRHDQAIAIYEKSIPLNPNNADGYSGLAEVLIYTGQYEKAILLLKKAMRLDPRSPPYYLYSLGNAYYLLKRYEEAIATLGESVEKHPDFLPSRIILVLVYAEMNREEAARAEAAQIMKRSPETSLEVLKRNIPFKDPEVLKRVLEALSKAGLK